MQFHKPISLACDAADDCCIEVLLKVIRRSSSPSLVMLLWTVFIMTTAAAVSQQLSLLEVIDESFYGEGMEYSPLIDRFLFGSLQEGTLLSVPRAPINSSAAPHYAAADVEYLIPTRPDAFQGSNFLGLQMDPVAEDIVWACVANLDLSPDDVVGIARINITAAAAMSRPLASRSYPAEVLQFFDLSALASPSHGQMAVFNDLVMDPGGQFVFITDTFGYQVIRFDVLQGTAEVWNNGSMFCTQCLGTEAHYDGPNGIEYYAAKASADDFLLVALGSRSQRVLRISAVTAFAKPVEVKIVTGHIPVTNMDAIIFHPLDHLQLFICGNGINAVYHLQAASEDWSYAKVVEIYNAQCPQQQPSALTMVQLEDVASNTNTALVAYCTNGFGPAPYPLTTTTISST